MSPPQLSGNTPVSDVVRPVMIKLIHTGGDQTDFSLVHRFDRRLDQFVHFHEPLLFDHGFNDTAAAVMMAHTVLIGFYLH